jgi:CHAT domain-containing protein
MREDAKKPRERREGSPEFVAFGFPYDAEVESKETGDSGDVPKELVAPVIRSGRGILYWSPYEVIEVAKLFAKEMEEQSRLDATKAAFDKESLSTKVGKVAGKNFALFLRQEANEAAFRTENAVGKARVVHFACHGEADLTSPQLSRLVLTRSKKLEEATGEDGYVYVRDLKRLRLAADLLVLSACGSNDGTRSPVEGITGLSRAGLVAGAKSVLSTLWPVDDAAARDLMVDFYRRWIQGGQTRIHSLSGAKRAAIEKGLPIETWSAYTLFDAEVE